MGERDPAELSDLPFVDEHAREIDAPADVVWGALGEQLRHLGPGAFRQYGRLVGVEPLDRRGDPLVAGSTILGFRVAESEPRAILALAGRHRFSTYALIFRLEDRGARTLLRAETRAAFPGLGGEAYKTLVIRSRGHVLGMRRIIGGIERRSASS